MNLQRLYVEEGWDRIRRYTAEFIAGALFGDQEARVRAIMEKIIYAKSLKWQHECEYRLAVPLGQDEAPYDTLPLFPEEITETYLGLAMLPQGARPVPHGFPVGRC